MPNTLSFRVPFSEGTKTRGNIPVTVTAPQTITDYGFWRWVTTLPPMVLDEPQPGRFAGLQLAGYQISSHLWTPSLAACLLLSVPECDYNSFGSHSPMVFCKLMTMEHNLYWCLPRSSLNTRYIEELVPLAATVSFLTDLRGFWQLFPRIFDEFGASESSFSTSSWFLSSCTSVFDIW